MQKLISTNYIYLIPMLAAALVSLRCFVRRWPTPYRQFSVFLWLCLIVESFAIAWKWYLHKGSTWSYSQANVWIYDLLGIIRFLFFIGFYYQLLTSSGIKNLIRKLVIPLAILSIPELFLINMVKEPNAFTIVGANLITVLLCLAFFRQVIRDTEIVNLKNNPAVIISTGTLLYYSATTPLFMYLTLLNNTSHTLSASFFNINHVFNIIMYSLYLTSFLCKPSFQK